MTLISSFFTNLWSNLSTFYIPIVDIQASYFILGFILLTFLLSCFNKILGKENGDGKS